MYLGGMGRNVLTLIKHNIKPLALDQPEHPLAKAVQRFLTLKNPTVTDFDDTVTRVTGGPSPIFPFGSVMEYYSWASCHHMVKDVRVPYLSISAADDPILFDVPPPCCGENSFVVSVLTASGGHLGWFQSGGRRWTTKPLLEWLHLMGSGVTHDLTRLGSPLYVDHDGYIKEEGKAELGCKETGEGCLIDGNRRESELFQGL